MTKALKYFDTTSWECNPQSSKQKTVHHKKMFMLDQPNYKTLVTLL